MFGRLDSDLRVTNIAERSVASEDHDAAPSREASITQKGKPATCLLADTLRGLLWAGDRDGWVSAYDISHTPGTALDPASAQLHSWHAHRVGHVAAMTVGPTGELWTASSRGSIRTWRHTASSPAKDSSSKIMMEAILPPKARELRRGTGERAHSGPVLALACSSDGQIIWSASARSVVLWDSSSGAYLGMLQRSGGLGGSTTGSTVNLSDFYSSKVVNSAKGLDVDELTGAVLVRPGAAERAKWHAQQEAWAAQSDRGVAELAERLSEGAGKAVKFMGKLGMRLAGIGGSSVSSTAAERYPPPSQHSAPSLSIDTDEATLGDGALPGSITGTSTGKVGGDVVALVASPQNVMWVGYREGRVERYSAAGQYLGACDVAGRIQTMARVGLHMWVGMTNGVLCVLGPDGGGLKSFLAQRAGIVSIAQAGSRTFSLAADGSISGWSSAVPSVADTEAL